MPRVEEHIQELLKLPIEDRARVAKLLLDSLDEEPDDVDAEALRVAELARRVRAVADGTAELIDAEEVRRRIAARLREARTR
jgi:putative addiction module component (TIGR02574 family)